CADGEFRRRESYDAATQAKGAQTERPLAGCRQFRISTRLYETLSAKAGSLCWRNGDGGTATLFPGRHPKLRELSDYGDSRRWFHGWQQGAGTKTSSTSRQCWIYGCSHRHITFA